MGRLRHVAYLKPQGRCSIGPNLWGRLCTEAQMISHPIRCQDALLLLLPDGQQPYATGYPHRRPSRLSRPKDMHLGLVHACSTASSGLGLAQRSRHLGLDGRDYSALSHGQKVLQIGHCRLLLQHRRLRIQQLLLQPPVLLLQRLPLLLQLR